MRIVSSTGRCNRKHGQRDLGRNEACISASFDAMLYEVHAHRLQSAASLGNVPDGTEHLKQELRGRLDVVPEPNIY